MTEEAVDLVDRMSSSITIDVRAVLFAIMHEWDGPAGFAHDVKQDHEKSPVGSANRVRIDTAILSALQKCGESGGGDNVPMDELQAMAAQALKEEGSDAVVG